MRTSFERPRHSVDGIMYEFEMLPISQALRLSVRIISVIATSASKVFSCFKEGKSILDQDINGQALGEAISMLVGGLSEDEVEGSINQLMAKTSVVDSKQNVLPVNMDIQFTGKIMHLYRVTWKALEVNFGDFLGDSIGQKLKDKVNSLIQEESTSTG